MVQHEITGMISPHGEPEILRQHLLLLLDNNALRRELGSNAKRWGLRHWALQPYIARTMVVYDEVLKTGVSRAMNKVKGVACMKSFAVPSALYNPLFTVPEVDQRILVDYLLWNQLKASLPAEYRIPDIQIIHAFEA